MSKEKLAKIATKDVQVPCMKLEASKKKPAKITPIFKINDTVKLLKTGHQGKYATPPPLGF
jgi:hypothetical protein